MSDEGLPVIVAARDDAALLALLQELQLVLLRHPVAARAAFGALAAEGRRFAETAEGRVWAARLVGSPALGRARLVWEAAAAGVPEDPTGTALPSAWLDAFVEAAARPGVEGLLARLLDPPEAP